MRFDATALTALLPDLAEPQRALLAARTEGWPVALQHDWSLAIGMAISLWTCGRVTLLALMYRGRAAGAV